MSDKDRNREKIGSVNQDAMRLGTAKEVRPLGGTGGNSGGGYLNQGLSLQDTRSGTLECTNRGYAQFGLSGLIAASSSPGRTTLGTQEVVIPGPHWIRSG